VALLGVARSPLGWGEGQPPSSGHSAQTPLQVRIVPELAGPATAVSLGAQPGAASPNAILHQPAEVRSMPMPATSNGRAPAQGIALVPPPKYYHAAELDARPQIKTRVMPVFPVAADLQNIAGKVVVSVFISETGNVDDVAVARAEPAGIFEQSTMAAFRAAKFTPGIKDRKPVKSLVVLEVAYDAAPQSDPVRLQPGP